MFRGNSLATKAMEAYMKLIADDYLQDTLGDFIRELLSCEESCEVDPLKLAAVSQSVLEKNRSLLLQWVERAWKEILLRLGPFSLFEDKHGVQLQQTPLRVERRLLRFEGSS